MATAFKKLRQLRKINEITLAEVASKTGLSIGYLNRIERGYIQDIKNLKKRQSLVEYIQLLEKSTRENPAIAEQFAPVQE